MNTPQPPTKRYSIPQLFLWLFVISAGVVTGGSIYEMLVVWPLWAGSPPESVMLWKQGPIQGVFFARATPLYAFFALALALGSRWMPQRQRAWSLAAGISGVII